MGSPEGGDQREAAESVLLFALEHLLTGSVMYGAVVSSDMTMLRRAK